MYIEPEIDGVSFYCDEDIYTYHYQNGQAMLFIDGESWYDLNVDGEEADPAIDFFAMTAEEKKAELGEAATGDFG